MSVVLLAEVVQRRVGLTNGIDVCRASFVEVDVHGADIASGLDGGGGVLSQVLNYPIGIEGASGERGCDDLANGLVYERRDEGRWGLTGIPPASWTALPKFSMLVVNWATEIPEVSFWSLWPNYTIISAVPVG